MGHSVGRKTAPGHERAPDSACHAPALGGIGRGRVAHEVASWIASPAWCRLGLGRSVGDEAIVMDQPAPAPRPLPRRRFRLARASDADAVDAFLGRLSPATLQARYLSPRRLNGAVRAA